MARRNSSVAANTESINQRDFYFPDVIEASLLSFVYKLVVKNYCR